MLDLPLLKSLCVGTEIACSCFLLAECLELQGVVKWSGVME